MIPPQALNAIGLALAKAAAMGLAQFTTRTLEGGFDRDIFRLSKLDERSLLVEIARRDSTDATTREMLERLRRTGTVRGQTVPAPNASPEKLAEQGQATVTRLLPKVKALICPHRETIMKAAGAPEVVFIASVAGYLVGGLPGALVNPIATLLVKRGIPALCGTPAGR